MPKINDKVTRKARREAAIYRQTVRLLRSTRQQLEELSMRRGNSAKEIARLTRSLDTTV